MEDIRKTFPGVMALNNVRFDLQRGEVHVLLGENGAGKSTLIKLLGGALKKDAGRILLDGREVDIRGPHHAQELGIGIIYQELHLVPHLSAAENIFLGREPELFPGIIDQQTLYAKAQEIIDGLHVDIDAHAIVKTLSVAQQQMVEIAKAVSLDVRILVMDEPTSALTGSEIEQLFAMIKRLKMTGVSIVYISHRLDEIFQVGDRVTVLLDGKYVGTYGIGELSRAELVRLMVNREIKEHFPKVRTPRGEEKLRVEHVMRAGELNDISFSLYGGEVLGVAGLLGSGRTELARAIFGLDAPDSGTISINGTVQTNLNPRRAVKLGLGYLTEDRKNQGLILRLSVKENILLASLDRLAKFGVLDPATESATAQRYVEDLRIKTPGIDQQVVNLSGGNQQKVVLSKWLCSEAQIFIFDEPTRGIDVGAKVEIYKLMNGLTERGAAVLMISSELPEILGMSDRIMVMREGSVAALLDAADATQEVILHHALVKVGDLSRTRHCEAPLRATDRFSNHHFPMNVIAPSAAGKAIRHACRPPPAVGRAHDPHPVLPDRLQSDQRGPAKRDHCHCRSRDHVRHYQRRNRPLRGIDPRTRRARDGRRAACRRCGAGGDRHRTSGRACGRMRERSSGDIRAASAIYRHARHHERRSAGWH